MEEVGALEEVPGGLCELELLRFHGYLRYFQFSEVEGVVGGEVGVVGGQEGEEVGPSSVDLSGFGGDLGIFFKFFSGSGSGSIIMH